MPLVMRVLLVFTKGARFVNTKSLAVTAKIEAGPGVLSPYPLSFLPPGIFAATLFCFEPGNEFFDFPIR